MKTLYAVLGVGPDVDQADLENAYLRLKVRYPQEKIDADENARIQFQGITQAYKTLSNPDSRLMYDKRLASAGVRTVTLQARGDDDSPGWISTRNVVIAGLMAVIISGMWVYHSREKARMEKEVIDHALQLVEEEKKRNADLREAEEARRQVQFENSQKNQDLARERQLRNDALQSSREAQSQSAVVQRQVMYDQQLQQQRAQQEAMAKQRAVYEAERRLANDKQQLRAICMQRYNRPDC